MSDCHLQISGCHQYPQIVNRVFSPRTQLIRVDSLKKVQSQRNGLLAEFVVSISDQSFLHMPKV